MKYLIEFLYTDDNELYQDDVVLKPEELARVEKFLTSLEEAGRISKVNGSDLVQPYMPPKRITFDELKANWKAGCLIRWGKDIGEKL